MNRSEDIEKLFEESAVEVNKQLDELILNESNKHLPQAVSSDIHRTILHIRISRFAIAAAIILAVSLILLFVNNEPQKQDVNIVAITKSPETPSDLVSIGSLNTAFRSGGMKAVEKQFETAEKKVKPTLKENITVDDLLCELGVCEEI